jgi:hypothetical protein
MSPSIELPPEPSSSAWNFNNSAKRRYHQLLQQQQQQQQLPPVKVVSPQELKGIVARLSRSPGDPPPLSPRTYHSSGSHQQQQQQQQQLPPVKVVSPQELKGIVARLSRSPGDPPPLSPRTYHSSGSHQQRQQQHQQQQQQPINELDLLQQPGSTFRPISSPGHSPPEPSQALRDLLPQASQGGGQGLSQKLASTVVGSKLGAAGCDAAPFLFPCEFRFSLLGTLLFCFQCLR